MSWEDQYISDLRSMSKKVPVLAIGMVIATTINISISISISIIHHRASSTCLAILLCMYHISYICVC